MILVFNAVLPVFLLAALGFWLYRIGFISTEISTGLNKLVYWVGLPSLLFHKISRQHLDWGSVGDVLLAFFSALIVTILLAYLATFWLRVRSDSVGAFVQAAYRGNLGFIGLPIVLYSVSAETMERSQAIAAIALAPCAIVFNLVAVFLMIIHQPERDGARPRILLSMVTNPLIIGGAAGVLVAFLQMPVPLFLGRSFEGLSNMSVPVALIGLGSSFGAYGWEEIDRRFVLAASGSTILKVVISPLLGILFALGFQLDAVEARIVVVYLATPTAIASQVIVGQFGGDEKLAGSAIVVATLASILFLPVALWLTQEPVWSSLSASF